MPTTVVATAPDETCNRGLRRPDAGRPAYNCPQCRQRAMQFFRLLPEESPAEWAS
jgi:hypothetical protein